MTVLPALGIGMWRVAGWVLTASTVWLALQFVYLQWMAVREAYRDEENGYKQDRNYCERMCRGEDSMEKNGKFYGELCAKACFNAANLHATYYSALATVMRNTSLCGKVPCYELLYQWDVGVGLVVKIVWIPYSLGTMYFAFKRWVSARKSKKKSL
jgi:hypothetical protein